MVTFAFAHAPVKTSVEILRLLVATPSMTLAEVAAEIGKTPRAIEMAASKLVKEGRYEICRPAKGRPLGGDFVTTMNAKSAASP